MTIIHHIFSEFAKPHSTCKPSRWNNHIYVFWFQLFYLIYEQVIKGSGLSPCAVCIFLIRRIANHHIELEFSHLLRLQFPYLQQINRLWRAIFLLRPCE